MFQPTVPAGSQPTARCEREDFAMTPGSATMNATAQETLSENCFAESAQPEP